MFRVASVRRAGAVLLMALLLVTGTAVIRTVATAQQSAHEEIEETEIAMTSHTTVNLARVGQGYITAAQSFYVAGIPGELQQTCEDLVIPSVTLLLDRCGSLWEGEDVVVQIASSASGPSLGTASRNILDIPPAPSPRWINFGFREPIAVQQGDEYYIRLLSWGNLMAPSEAASWQSGGAPACGGDPPVESAVRWHVDNTDPYLMGQLYVDNGPGTPFTPRQGNDADSRVLLQLATRSNVLVAIYDPVLHTKGDIRLTQYLHQQRGITDPMARSAQLQHTIFTASNGAARVKLLGPLTLDKFPPKGADTYTEAEYLSDYESGHMNWDGSFVYGEFLAEPVTIDPQQRPVWKMADDGDIDEVWLWVDETARTAESNMIGPNAQFINGDPIQYPGLTRRFIMMNFNYTMDWYGAQEESFTHRHEWIIKWLDPNGWDSYYLRHFWRLARDNGGFGSIGNPHAAFNSPAPGSSPPILGGDPSEWDTVSTRYAWTDEREWEHFPDFHGIYTWKNCRQWGCNHDGYQTWYMEHIPKTRGTDGLMHNNWWSYTLKPACYLP